MPRRINIPFIVDIVFIDDAAQMSELNGHRSISRALSNSGGLFARAFHVIVGFPKPPIGGTWNRSNLWRLGSLGLGFQPYFAWKRISDRGVLFN